MISLQKTIVILPLLCAMSLPINLAAAAQDDKRTFSQNTIIQNNTLLKLAAHAEYANQPYRYDNTVRVDPYGRKEKDIEPGGNAIVEEKTNIRIGDDPYSGDPRYVTGILTSLTILVTEPKTNTERSWSWSFKKDALGKKITLGYPKDLKPSVTTE